MGKFGEEFKGDSSFVADCRLLQSIYREEIGEEIRPYPDKKTGKLHYYGNYIAGGEDSGANFLAGYIFKYAKQRVSRKKTYETIASDRLFNNLLSSQPMAFNLFCPLMRMLQESPDVATEVVKAALPMFPIHRLTEVELEFIPENYLELTGDKSAMDAIVRYENHSGKKGFIAIETKYSENLGNNAAMDSTGRPRAQAVNAIKSLHCFNPDIERRINDGKIKLTQIYRNFLLSESYALKEGLESYSIVLAPERNRSTAREVASLENELSPEYKCKIRAVSLEDFTGRLIDASSGEYRDIFERFFDRYLNFGKLEGIE